jgi:hypothetical protein
VYERVGRRGRFPGKKNSAKTSSLLSLLMEAAKSSAAAKEQETCVEIKDAESGAESGMDNLANESAVEEVEGGEEEDEDSSEDDDNDEDDFEAESSCTGASEREEEAQYADQPACGLPPHLVVRRGCQTLQAQEAAGGSSDSPKIALPPLLHRVDTVLGFEHAVGRVDPTALASPAPTAETHGLERSMSGLPEVEDAFAAVAADKSRAEPQQPPEPLRVHRVDTMELLAPPPGAEDDGDARAVKRQRSGLAP